MLHGVPLLAFIAGLCASVLAHLCREAFVRRFGNRDQFSRLIQEIHELIAELDPSQLPVKYFQLLWHGLQFTAFQWILAAVSLVPVVATFLLASLAWSYPEVPKFAYLRATPAQPVTLQFPDREQTLAPGEFTFAIPEGIRECTWSRDGRIVAHIKLLKKLGSAKTTGKRFLMWALGFEIAPLPENDDNASLVTIHSWISRPLVAANNPLWPWLDDSEVGFLAAASTGALVLKGMRRQRK